MSHHTMRVYLELLSRQMSLLLRKYKNTETHVIQSAIHLEDDLPEGYFVAIREGGEDTKIALFTYEEIEAAQQRVKDLPSVAIASLRMDIDLDVKEDTPFEDDRAIVEARMLEHYGCWDFLRLFFITFLR